MNISARMVVTVTTLTILVAVMGILGLYGMSKANDDTQAIYQDNMIPASQVAHMRVILTESRLQALNALMVKTIDVADSSAARIVTAMEETDIIIKDLSANRMAPQTQTLVQKFIDDYRDYAKRGLKPYVEALRFGEYNEAIKIRQEVLVPSYATERTNTSAILETLIKNSEEQYKSALVRYNYMRGTAIVGIIMALALAIGFALFVVHGVTRPLNQLLVAVDDLASGEGDLTRRLPKFKAELGRLANSVNQFIVKLQTIMSDVQTSAQSIGTATKEIAEGNSDLSQRTSEQASSLEETAASVEELASTIRNNAENSSFAAGLATETRAVAVKGGDIVGKVVTTMTRINDSSQQVANIIKVIEDIAFQTNMLALNAAIEAARAGEQGRGFSVVSGEVRSLAQRTSIAAKEIKELIVDSVSCVKEGTDLVGEAGQTMNDVVNSVKKLSEIVAEIATSSHEQSAGTEQVNRVIVQLDDFTQKNAALVEEAAASALALEDQVERLNSTVGLFKLCNVDASKSLRVAPADRHTTDVNTKTQKHSFGESRTRATRLGKVQLAHAIAPAADWSEF